MSRSAPTLAHVLLMRLGLILIVALVLSALVPEVSLAAAKYTFTKVRTAPVTASIRTPSRALRSTTGATSRSVIASANARTTLMRSSHIPSSEYRCCEQLWRTCATLPRRSAAHRPSTSSGCCAPDAMGVPRRVRR